MKTLTEFNGFTLNNALKQKKELTTAGKTPEELSQALAEGFKLEGDKLTLFLAALELAEKKAEGLKRILVLKLDEKDKAPAGAIASGEHHLVAEFFYVPQPKKDRGNFRGKGGKGGKHGKGRGDKRGGRGGRDNRGSGGPRLQNQAGKPPGDTSAANAAENPGAKPPGKFDPNKKKRFFNKRPLNGANPKPNAPKVEGAAGGTEKAKIIIKTPEAKPASSEAAASSESAEVKS